MKSSSLVLGTAQLGFAYGIANKTGKPDLSAAQSIVQTAWANGIREFDTARAYGESETVLGLIISSLSISDQIKVITKLHPETDLLDKSEISKSVQLSLGQLHIDRLYGLMIHDETKLKLWDVGAGENLTKIVQDGLVSHIGISLYSPEKALQALDIEGISMIQIPSNFLDRRFEEAGVFRKASDLNKQIYVRSVFLQGLILMNPNDIPMSMKFAEPTIIRIRQLTMKYGISTEELALGYAKRFYPDAKIIFGAETPGQTEKNIKCFQYTLSEHIALEGRNFFKDIDHKIINPQKWPQKRIQP